MFPSGALRKVRRAAASHATSLALPPQRPWPLQRPWPCPRHVPGPCNVPGTCSTSQILPRIDPGTCSTSQILPRSDPGACSTSQILPRNDPGACSTSQILPLNDPGTCSPLHILPCSDQDYSVGDHVTLDSTYQSGNTILPTLQSIPHSICPFNGQVHASIYIYMYILAWTCQLN